MPEIVDSDRPDENRDAAKDPGWLAEARRNLERWAAEEEPPPADASAVSDTAGDDVPDLYSFYAELRALRHEMLRGLKRQHEMGTKVTEVLERFDAVSVNGPSPNLKNIALPVVDVAIRLDRFQRALGRMPPKKLFGNYAAWKEYASSLSNAFDIIRGHFAAALDALDIAPITAAGEPFDPRTMTAVAIDESGAAPDNTVVEELTPGFLMGGRPVKMAEVKVAKSTSTKGSE